MSVVSSAYFTTTVSFPIALRSEIMTTIVVNASTNWQTIPTQTNYNLADKKGPIRSKMPICIGSFYGCELTQSIVVFMDSLFTVFKWWETTAVGIFRPHLYLIPTLKVIP